MSGIGSIEQRKGPFTIGSSFQYNGSYIIGVSLGEKDYMSYDNNSPTYKMYEDYPSPSTYGYYEYGDVYFVLTESTDTGIAISTVHLGRTSIYETQQAIKNPLFSFPEGAPASLIIDLVQTTL